MSIMGKFLKIAGKDPNGNVKGVAVTENGEVKVQQTGRNVLIRTIQASSSSIINSSSSEEIIINPTPGYIAKIATIYFYGVAPNESTSGKHFVDISIDDSVYNLILARSAYNTGLLINRGTIEIADDLQRPETASEQQRLLLNVSFTNEKPLIITYTNNTNVEQTKTRIIYLTLIEEAITS